MLGSKGSGHMRAWITYMDYFATGEGQTLQLALVFAKTKSEAQERHLDAFNIKEKSTRKYFKTGISAVSPKSKTAVALFNEYFTNGEGLLRNITHAWGAAFKFEVHYNFS